MTPAIGHCPVRVSTGIAPKVGWWAAMMGRSHAASGAASGAVTGLWLTGQPIATIACACIGAGAALLPDLDHPNATVSHSAGALSQVIAGCVGAVTEHRGATHSLLGVGAVFGIASLGLFSGWVTVALVGFVVLAATNVVPKLRGSLLVFAVVCALAYGTIIWDPQAVWDPLAPLTVATVIAAGAATHIAGDCLTDSGCPVLWPGPWRTTLGLFSTGHAAERVVIVPLCLVVVAVCGLWRYWDSVWTVLASYYGQGGLP